MRGAGHVVHGGERRGAYSVLVGKPEWLGGGDRLEDLGLDGRIITKGAFKI
jgi:hypothetical protein